MIPILCFLVLFVSATAKENLEKLLSVALLQMVPDGNHQQANFDKAEDFCRKAATVGADIALMPEMWNIGYTRFTPHTPEAQQAFFQQAQEKEGAAIQRFAELADELDMAIGVTYMQKWDGPPRNAITLFDRHGKEVYTYAKVHTSDMKTTESGMTPGDGFPVGELDTKIGPVKVGSMICFDREFPESARILMLNGAELVLTPNACTLEEKRLDQFKVRAWENQMCVAMTNYPEPVNNGHSPAYDQEGNTVVIGGEHEGIFFAVFDIARLRERRAKTSWGNAYRRPHRYHQLISNEKDDLWKRNSKNVAGDGKEWKAEER
ncbi:carbon-nitrogen hydrolase family protein [candidate division KSB1 bacterium]|nr:carbon-nitrogen hydrolase family protein [candidate division KSB1 bacterium]